MSQVLSNCLPSFGAVPGISWIWIRVFSVALYNAWRLHAIAAMRAVAQSKLCNTRKKLLAHRTYYGGTFRDYLKRIFQSWEVPVMFHAPDEDESEVVALMAMSPVKRPRDVLKVTYKEWSTSPEWINFRKGGTHLVQRISAM
jgi:hypothetical protein